MIQFLTWPDQVCARCGFPVPVERAIAVLEVEQGTGRGIERLVHEDIDECMELLG